MNEKIKLDDWMKRVWIPPVAGAEKYTTCQRLSREQTIEIMELVAKAAEFNLNSLTDRANQLDRGEPYRTFLECYLNLMFVSDKDDLNHWRKNLWNALYDVDKAVMKNYARRLYGLEIETLL